MGLDKKSPSIQTTFIIFFRNQMWQYVENVNNCEDLKRRNISADEFFKMINEK